MTAVVGRAKPNVFQKPVAPEVAVVAQALSLLPTALAGVVQELVPDAPA